VSQIIYWLTILAFLCWVC